MVPTSTYKVHCVCDSRYCPMYCPPVLPNCFMFACVAITVIFFSSMVGHHSMYVIAYVAHKCCPGSTVTWVSPICSYEHIIIVVCGVCGVLSSVKSRRFLPPSAFNCLSELKSKLSYMYHCPLVIEKVYLQSHCDTCREV